MRFNPFQIQHLLNMEDSLAQLERSFSGPTPWLATNVRDVPKESYFGSSTEGVTVFLSILSTEYALGGGESRVGRQLRFLCRGDITEMESLIREEGWRYAGAKDIRTLHCPKSIDKYMVSPPLEGS